MGTILGINITYSLYSPFFIPKNTSEITHCFPCSTVSPSMFVVSFSSFLCLSITQVILKPRVLLLRCEPSFLFVHSNLLLSIEVDNWKRAALPITV